MNASSGKILLCLLMVGCGLITWVLVCNPDPTSVSSNLTAPDSLAPFHAGPSVHYLSMSVDRNAPTITRTIRDNHVQPTAYSFQDDTLPVQDDTLQPPRPDNFPETATILRDVPFFQKRPDFGGEACVAMVLQRMGHNADQDFVFDTSGVDPLLGRGCVTQELVATINAIGFSAGEAWHRIPDNAVEQTLERDWQKIETQLENGIASVACIRNDDAESFVLMVGIDTTAGEIYFHNPSKLRGAFNTLSRDDWYASAVLGADPNSRDARFLVRIPLAAGQIILCETAETFTAADYAQHIRTLKTKIPGDNSNGDFKIVIQPPFVVVGDQSQELVEQHAERTIKWAVDKIKLDYFTRDPEEIIDVWLFKDKESYDKHNVELFGSQPTTPFGFYSPSDRALVMNISTGGGTLVHEIVHPFIASNFPECPSWFNEGLASLYEQSREEDGHIMGSTNWRLRGLHGAIDSGSVASFENLCSTTRRQFYNDDRGTNYAQARYLCYYLQENDLLVKFYHQFRENVGEDPTGYLTLQDVLGNPDMEEFKALWEQFVTDLRF